MTRPALTCPEPKVHRLSPRLRAARCQQLKQAFYDGERRAATTPPPVRVIRLRADDPAALPGPHPLAFAALAAQCGRAAVEQMTNVAIARGGSTPVENAKLAGRFARLALGTTALLLALALPAGALQQPECAADTLGAGGGCVNVNTATAAELEHLHRIGPALALRIVEEREAGGPFASMLDLERVKGIGGATVCLNQRAVVFAGESSRTEEYHPEEVVVTSCKANPSAGNCVDC